MRASPSRTGFTRPRLRSSPGKEVDVDLLVFVERYATDLLKWDILTFFAHNPNFSAPASQIARQIGRSTYSIQPELGDLALLGILVQVQAPGDQITYQLTQTPHLRRVILKFANQWTGLGTDNPQSQQLLFIGGFEEFSHRIGNFLADQLDGAGKGVPGA